jgi:hypothetical protein
MSDEEENSSESEEEENSDDDESEQDTVDGDDVDNEADKLVSVQEDISVIKDIFSYIDQTSRRLSNKFDLERDLRTKSVSEKRRQHLEDMETPDVSWSQYENLDDIQRAELLEKAIMVLGQDNSTRR